MASLNKLLLLKEFTNVNEKEKGFVIVRRNFLLSKKIYDLGFIYKDFSFIDEDFYSIPILKFSKTNKETIAYFCKKITDENHQLNRFFVNISPYENSLLVEAYPHSSSVNLRIIYTPIKFSSLKKLNPEGADKIKEIKKNFLERLTEQVINELSYFS